MLSFPLMLPAGHGYKCAGWKPSGSKPTSCHTQHAERCLSFAGPSGSPAFDRIRYKSHLLPGFIIGYLSCCRPEFSDEAVSTRCRANCKCCLTRTSAFDVDRCHPFRNRIRIQASRFRLRVRVKPVEYRLAPLGPFR